MNNQPYKHEITQIAPKTWCISEFRLVNTYLLEGEERAALIDTGCGIGSLKDAVRELTDKPLYVLITHNHFDHDGGVEQFPDAPVYLHSADGATMSRKTELMNGMDLNQLREFYITSRAPIRCPDLDMNELLKMIPDQAADMIYDYIPMEDGTEFDLGGRVLKVISTPGHTPGEVSILDENSRILFTGDTANASIILMRQPNNGTALIEECRQTMEKLWAMEAHYDCLGVGHDTPPIDKQIIKDYCDLTAGLLNGTIIGEYEEVGIRKGEVARLGRAELWYQCDA